MSKIRINYPGVTAADNSFRRAIWEMERVESELATLQRVLPLEVQKQLDIAFQIKNCRAVADEIQRKSKKLLDVVEGGLHQYQEAEENLNRSIPKNGL